MKDAYQPIDCRLHSELELLAMHRSLVRLKIREDGEVRTLHGLITNLYARAGAEYLEFVADTNKLEEIRLDKVLAFES